MEKYILLKFYIFCVLIFGFDGSEFACFNQSCVELCNVYEQMVHSEMVE